MKKRAKADSVNVEEKTVDQIVETVNNILKAKKIDGKVLTFDSGKIEKIPVVSTGIPSLDAALGVGGLPKGRIIEIYGSNSSGKTTSLFSMIAYAQSIGIKCAIIDTEHSLDILWARSCGVNVNKLMIFQPDCGEDALDCCKAMVNSGVGFVAVDSVAALVPRAELMGDASDQTIGLQARLMGSAMRRVSGSVRKNGCVIVFTNQVRQNISKFGYGDSKVTPGGEALKFYASVRMEIAKISSNKEKDSGKEDEDVISNNVKIKIVKNKVAPPFKVCTAVLNFKSGFEVEHNLFRCLIGSRIKKSGSWFTWDGTEKMGQGEASALEWFKENTDKEIIQDLYKEYLDEVMNPTPKKKKKKQ